MVANVGGRPPVALASPYLYWFCQFRFYICHKKGRQYIINIDNKTNHHQRSRELSTLAHLASLLELLKLAIHCVFSIILLFDQNERLLPSCFTEQSTCPNAGVHTNHNLGFVHWQFYQIFSQTGVVGGVTLRNSTLTLKQEEKYDHVDREMATNRDYGLLHVKYYSDKIQTVFKGSAMQPCGKSELLKLLHSWLIYLRCQKSIRCSKSHIVDCMDN